MADTVLVHPNRDKAESKATKAAVILLLVTSAALILIVTIGGWSELQGWQIVSFGYVDRLPRDGLRRARRWNRGVLPVAAGLAILFAVVAAVAAPAWFARDKAGFADPALEPSILGLLTMILVPVQLLLIAFAMRGFQQKWNVEVEVSRDEAERDGPRLRRRPAAAGIVISGAGLALVTSPARVAERHTRSTQNPLPERACGFESHPGHD